MSDPKFIIFTGPMFGSKTTRLLAAVDRYKHQNKKIVAFKPKMDNRYSNVEICTHSGGKLPAIGVDTGRDIESYIENSDITFDVVAIDEAFMIPEVAEAAIEIYKSGVTVLVSSLQLSSAGKPYKEMSTLLPWATSVQICPAVCSVCGEDAFFTRKKSGDDNGEIEIGGSELYEPVCFRHYFDNVNL